MARCVLPPESDEEQDSRLALAMLLLLDLQVAFFVQLSHSYIFRHIRHTLGSPPPPPPPRMEEGATITVTALYSSILCRQSAPSSGHSSTTASPPPCLRVPPCLTLLSSFSLSLSPPDRYTRSGFHNHWPAPPFSGAQQRRQQQRKLLRKGKGEEAAPPPSSRRNFLP